MNIDMKLEGDVDEMGTEFAEFCSAVVEFCGKTAMVNEFCCWFLTASKEEQRAKFIELTRKIG